jgi:hypothetical protein
VDAPAARITAERNGRRADVPAVDVPAAGVPVIDVLVIDLSAVDVVAIGVYQVIDRLMQPDAVPLARFPDRGWPQAMGTQSSLI